ncbi:MAG: DNA mismatch repair protein MutL [Deltaproteobacteria bacterium HGW-Deltaproteobacteria-4]|nr:MAG: DNA mismatch repair protein MutL [Deltaproteobacteria bacterium HGW-Deltaproteobacteria-4]
MSAQIHLLPENLCNQIAAGEVVERPASVVKELVENSLDAHATQITIEIEGGGSRLIRVSDDGDGMGKDDVFLCLERHATSKISNSADLFRLQTLGFRGEALPSIAAVSRLTVRSQTATAPEGWELYVEAGTVKKAGAIGLPTGTTIEVRDLFFNTPARRKFLRKEETEFGHIAELVTRLALCSPEVQFQLVHNQRTILNAPRQHKLAERIATLLGRPLLADLVKVDKADPGAGLELQGLISHPNLHRSSSAAIYTYINGRYVRDRVVQHAILDGLRHLFPRGRYPVAVLFLSIPGAAVDVNVHPTKHEVRFSQQSLVHDFIAGAVKEALRPGIEILDYQRPEVKGSHGNYGSYREAMTSPVAAPLPVLVAPKATDVPQVSEPLATWATPATIAPFAGSYFSSLRIIGQFRASYIVAEDDEHLLLIDQHAAHERIGFERLRREFHSGAVARQGLLFPEIVEFDFKETALLSEHLAPLRRLGFELEPFGPRTFALKAVPQLLAGRDNFVQLLHDLASDLGELGVSRRIEDALDSFLLLISCHGMVRARQKLSLVEMTALLVDLDGIDFNAHCPHGRPVYSRLSDPEIARLFRRSA